MDDQNKNLILASVLSFVVIIVWFVLFPPPEPIQTEEQNIEQTQTKIARSRYSGKCTLPSDLSDSKDVPSIEIETDRVVGSISLEGGRIDNLSLRDYRVALDETAE